MSKLFTIFLAGDKPDSPDLLGLEIEETEEGYELVAPRRVLATTSLINMDPEPGKPIMKFHFKRFQGYDWTIDVDSATPEKMQGRWYNSDHKHSGLPEESDSWTASGTGAEGEDEAKAAKAY